MLGLGLYIGEGSKTHGQVRFVNSDPRTIKLAITWFQNACGLSKKNFALRLHLYHDSDAKRILAFWRKVTGLPKEQFHRSWIDVRTGKSLHKSGKLPYGTAHLYIRAMGNPRHGVFFARKIEKWSDVVFKLTGAGMV